MIAELSMQELSLASGGDKICHDYNNSTINHVDCPIGMLVINCPAKGDGSPTVTYVPPHQD
jgi:hypothetical protein